MKNMRKRVTVKCLTIHQALEIVRNCLRIVTGEAKTLKPNLRLGTVGIDSRAKLKRFKLVVVLETAEHKHKITLSDLTFGQDDVLETVYELLQAVTMTPRYLVAPRHERTPGTNLRVKHTKKKAAKKHPQKAMPKARRERDIEVVERGSYAGGAAAPGSEPTKRKRIKKDGSHGSSKRTEVEHESYAESASSESFGIEEIELARKLRGYARDTDKTSPAQPPSPSRTIECTPQMEIQTELIQKKAYRMRVFVNRGPIAEGSEVERVRVEVPHDLREFPLQVWLDCSSHFDVEDVSDPPIVKVNTETATSDELGFTLKVLTTTDKSPMFVSAFFRYNGRPSGKITRFLEWADDVLRWKKFAVAEETADQDEMWKEFLTGSEGREEEVVLPNADAEPSVAVETEGIPADIRVEVLRAKVNNGKDFTLKCYTPQGKWEGDWNLPMVSKDLVNTYMKNFMADKGEARIASLEGAGMDFWDALPDDEVRELLLLALEKGAHTMSVISEEPYIPWELIVPYRDLDNTRKPLSVELQMGRWITGNYQAARQRISLKSVPVVLSQRLLG